MDSYLATHTERLSARSVPRVVIAPVAHTFLARPGTRVRPGTTRGARECDRLAQGLNNGWL